MKPVNHATYLNTMKIIFTYLLTIVLLPVEREFAKWAVRSAVSR